MECLLFSCVVNILVFSYQKIVWVWQGSTLSFFYYRWTCKCWSYQNSSHL